MNKSNLQHAAEVHGSLLESREDATCLLEPTDQPFDDIPSAVSLTVEFHGSRVAVFVFFGRNDGLNSKFEEVLVNPVGTVSFVGSQCHRPSDGFTIAVQEICVRTVQYGFQRPRLVRLSGGELEMQRMTVAIAENMNLRRKTPARAA